ncbi:hypothetical protein ACFPRL_33540 [Pseudoclavibacter helvolus]
MLKHLGVDVWKATPQHVMTSSIAPAPRAPSWTWTRHFEPNEGAGRPLGLWEKELGWHELGLGLLEEVNRRGSLLALVVTGLTPHDLTSVRISFKSSS